MGHHPETLIYSFPPYVRTIKGKDGKNKPRRLVNWLYRRLYPLVGFTLWHVDPCENVPYQRDDDSCGWLERRPGDYESAMKRTLSDTNVRKMVTEAMIGFGRVPGMPHVERYPPVHVGAAVYKTIAMDLEYGRRSYVNSIGRRESVRYRARRMTQTLEHADHLAFNSVDNLLHVCEYTRLVTLIATSLNRKFRPWYKHPRWHMHHWRFSFNLPHNLRRAFIDRCAHCHKTIGWGKSPTSTGHGATKKLYHTDCPSS